MTMRKLDPNNAEDRAFTSRRAVVLPGVRAP
jgi:hypothetical protein